MSKIVVNREALREIVEDLVDNCNDCACCPLYFDCNHLHDISIKCVNEILFDYLQEKD